MVKRLVNNPNNCYGLKDKGIEKEDIKKELSQKHFFVGAYKHESGSHDEIL